MKHSCRISVASLRNVTENAAFEGTRGEWYFQRSIVVRQRSLARKVDQIICNDASRRVVDERTAHDFPEVRHRIDSQKLRWGADSSQQRYAPGYGDHSADLQITTAFALAGNRGEYGLQQQTLPAVLPSNLIRSFRWCLVIAVNSPSLFLVFFLEDWL